MNSYFLAIILDPPQLKVMEGVLQKHNPLYKFVPLHIPLSKVFEIEASEEKNLINQISLFLKNTESFSLSFKGLIQIGKNVHLNLVEGESALKRLRSNLLSMSFLKRSQLTASKNTIDHPLIAKDKSTERIKGALPFKTPPTFKIDVEAITLLKVESINENPVSFRFQLIKGDSSKQALPEIIED